MADRLGWTRDLRGGTGSWFDELLRGTGALVAALVLAMLAGCGSDQSPPVSEETSSPTPPAEKTRTSSARETAAGKSESPLADAGRRAKPSEPVSDEPEPDSEPAPVEQPVSAEQREAEAAFRVMTADDVSQEDRDAATDKLLEIGEQAVPVLVAGLQAEQSLQREMAATMLAFLGAAAADARDPLIAALKDESDFVRANAATALAQMPGQAEHVVPVFSEFLDGDDEHLRKMAAMNLAVLDIEAAKPLVGQLVRLLSDEDRDVVLAIVELLGRIGPDARDAVEALKMLDPDDDAELEAAVAAALMEIEADPEPS